MANPPQLITKQFDGYIFKYSSYKGLMDSQPNTETSRSFAAISLFKGNTWVGVIDFIDREKLDLNSYQNNVIRMNCHISRFNDIINIIRYEKPLRIVFDPSKIESWIESTPSTQYEPVGEQEGV